MSTVQVEATPVAQDTSVQTPVKAPDAQAQQAGQQEPNWLPMRLEQAKRSGQNEVLKGLGFESADALKARLDELKKLEDAQKTEQQRIAERLSELEPKAKRASELEERFSRIADTELAKLSDQQRTAVLAIAGNDKGKALDAIELLRPTWSAAPVPLAAPVATTATTSAPTPAPTTSTNHLAVWESLRQQNPVMAAQYYLSNANEIEAAAKNR